MAQAHSDDGFHEIQLNGKQLVFLFMAVTVVSVVIFLCGVLVGRNVRVSQTARAEQAAAAGTDLTPSVRDTPAPAQSADPTAAPPAPAAEEPLTFYDRLEEGKQRAETLKPESPRGSPAPESARARVPTPAPVTVPPKAVPPTPVADAKPSALPANAPDASLSAAPPSGRGFAVQLAALNDRGEADAIAKRLTTKGYAAYVVTPANGTPVVYRVRVGSFKTRHEAETLADKLRKEEQFSPWVTR